MTADTLHEWAANWCARIGVPVESELYLRAVSAWRRAWRPERVKILVAAESHVAEATGDALASVNSPRWMGRDLPVEFVRLVYCLGYGEPDLCRTPKPSSNGGGTWQFWDLLGQIALGYGAHNRQPRKATSTLGARIRWKVHVLERLRTRGIWLEDASPIGLYTTGGGRILSSGAPFYRPLLRDAYERFIWPGVTDDQPKQVWTVGRSVASALAGLPGVASGRCISQPQAARTADQRERFEKDLAAMCSEIARVAR